MDNQARLEAWRASGEHRLDRVRFGFIEAMARRARVHEGEARRLLDARLEDLLAAYAADLEAARVAKAAEGVEGVEGASRAAASQPAGDLPTTDAVDHETLATLVAQLSKHDAGELKTLRYFRATWARLRADQRLTQSLAKVPDNAGPLNSHQLVHRSLTLMHELSPEYLNRFMAYVDGLMWAEGQEAGAASAEAGAGAGARSGPRAEGPRKAGRRKAA